jgi:hypothetical protein
MTAVFKADLRKGRMGRIDTGLRHRGRTHTGNVLVGADCLPGYAADIVFLQRMADLAGIGLPYR